MKKRLILFGLIIIICTSVAKYSNFENQEDDKILWSSKRKLIWDDFKGAVPDTTVILAITGYTIKLNYERLDNIVLNYKIENYFIKSKSWTVTTDTQTLAHEQLHFDIAELYARKIRKSFDSLRLRKNNNVDIYNEIYNSNISKCDKFQLLYDHQVSGNNKNQQQWIKKIGAELARLKRYEYNPNE
ncbi:hypothetical protein B0A58_11350 [Flavobacterium branchiophilum NBRC 15030 = ATCC 35035]|uniref:DUF922 domain-containing protein n=1 Tax=Flavobacterium branchiophilum TaxID=55197 RepID=A0A543FZP3_9FLAO|nr:hypothetical protein [Flavobacterium branchiophilum]OXA74149.1 hypothetical protein B0A58_11350 [Flavobacterium branchiophilum NBRC 15030 = ATCC 35035]TQM39303.1 hypothetical protein BC670_0083 [Flavobacterium branchiophilum]GEM54970.1 hypothetical protein FB1_11910 [Flavobacterium branchiophilum NBRC 15030 = ATCC 35035]